MRLAVNVKVYSFLGFPAGTSSYFPVDHIENMSFIMGCDSTVLDLKTQYSSRRNVSADRQYLIQPLTQDLQNGGSGPEHFRSGDIVEFTNSEKFSYFNVWDGEVFALLVDEFTSPFHYRNNE